MFDDVSRAGTTGTSWIGGLSRLCLVDVLSGGVGHEWPTCNLTFLR